MRRLDGYTIFPPSTEPEVLFTLEKPIRITGLYSFHYMENSKSFYFPGERHDFWEMVYVDSGEISVLADSTGHLLRQGDVIFHKPMEFHTIAADLKHPHNIMVTCFEVSGSAMDFFRGKSFSLDSTLKKVLLRFMTRCRELFSNTTDSRRERPPCGTHEQSVFQLAIGYLEEFLLLLMQHSPDGDTMSLRAKKNVENALADDILEYMEANVLSNLTLKDLCDRYHMGKSYLCQVFKQQTGKALIDTFIDLKITRAKHMIRSGELNFTQIADALGYSGLHHFTRTFKARTGMSPGTYSKSIT